MEFPVGKACGEGSPFVSFFNIFRGVFLWGSGFFIILSSYRFGFWLPRKEGKEEKEREEINEWILVYVCKFSFIIANEFSVK